MLPDPTPYLHTTTFLGWNILEWGDLALYLGAFAGLLFSAGYHILTKGKWRESAAGWNVMGMGVCLALVLLLNSSAVYFGDGYEAIRPYIRFPIYTLTTIVVVHRIFWLNKIQLRPAVHTVLDKLRKADRES